MDKSNVVVNSPTVATVSSSSRQYVRLFAEASSAELLALLLLSLREFVSLVTPTFALDDAIADFRDYFGTMWIYKHPARGKPSEDAFLETHFFVNLGQHVG